MEAVLDEEPGPVMPELLNLHMMVMSGGRERTGGQYRQLLGSSGWRLGDIIPLPSGQSILSAGAGPGDGPASAGSGS